MTIEKGNTYLMALRWRRSGQFNVGASSTNPLDWPEVSRGPLVVDSPAPTIVSAVWSRTATAAEQIVVTVTPAAGLRLFPIALYRRTGADPFVIVGTQLFPDADSEDDLVFTDTTVSGETLYDYHVVTNTALPSPPSAVTTVWAGPAGTPTFTSSVPLGAGYRVLFTNGLSGAAVELHDTYDNAGSVTTMALRATTAVDAVVADSGPLVNVGSPGLSFFGRLRYKLTQFTTDDFGQFPVEFDITVPNSE